MQFLKYISLFFIKIFNGLQCTCESSQVPKTTVAYNQYHLKVPLKKHTKGKKKRDYSNFYVFYA